MPSRVTVLALLLISLFLVGAHMPGLAVNLTGTVVVLDPIDNPEGDGSYTISWREVTQTMTPTPSNTPVFTGTATRTLTPALTTPTPTATTGSSVTPVAWVHLPLILQDAMAESISTSAHAGAPLAQTISQDNFIVEEDDNPVFTSPQIVYTGTLSALTLTDKPEGVYYYRVRRGANPWSNYEPVVVHVQSLACQTYREDFSSTSYRDTTNTTADWNTANGNLKLNHTLLPGLPQALTGMTAAYIPTTGKVYAFGGSYSTYGDTRDVVRFDPLAERWTNLSYVLPYAAAMNSTAIYVTETGKVYFFGGNGNDSSGDADIAEFDPNTELAQTLSVRLPSARYNASGAYAPNTGKAYIFGGYTGSGRTADILEFSPAAGTLSRLAVTLPSPRSDTSAVFVAETGKIYVFGGANSSSLSLDDIVEFDPVAGTVRTLTVRLPIRLDSSAAAYVTGTGKVYLFGGYFYGIEGGSYTYRHLDTIIQFDAVAGATTALPARLPSARSGMAVAYAPVAGKIYAFGGGSVAPLSEIMAFDPLSGQISPVGSVSTLETKLPQPRAWASSVYVPDTGKAYIFGGEGSEGRTDKIIAFDPIARSAVTLTVQLPTSKTSAAAVYVPTVHKAFIFGGWGCSSSYCSEIDQFDPIAGTLTTLPVHLGTGRYLHAAVFVPETGMVYVIGGHDGSPVNEVVEFNPVTGATRSIIGVLPQGLYNMQAVYVPTTGKVYVFGGAYSTYGATRDVVRFDPLTGQWTNLPYVLPYSATRGTTAVYAPQTGKVYLFGGNGNDSSGDSEIVEFDPMTEKADIVAWMPTARYATSGVYVPTTGRAYVFGGIFGNYFDTIVEARFDYYSWSAQAQSNELDRLQIGIISATLATTQTLNGQAVTYTLSNDGGKTWGAVSPGVSHTFTTVTGTDLRWRATLNSNGKVSPLVDQLSVVYCPDRTMPAPTAPMLLPVTNLNADGYYSVTWSTVTGTAAYLVEESIAPDFQNATVVYVGEGTQAGVTRREPGVYNYRVRSWNPRGYSPWSGAQQATVTLRIATPALSSISNPVGFSNYVLVWDEIFPGIVYTVQRDTSPDFSVPIGVYTGTINRSRQVAPELRTYYYRVKAADGDRISGWSNSQSTQAVLPGPESGSYSGSPSVSFSVTENQQVCSFRINAGGCSVSVNGCLDINGASIGIASLELGKILVISGSFDSRTHISGDYSVTMCGGTIYIPPRTGTWSASK